MRKVGWGFKTKCCEWRVIICSLTKRSYAAGAGVRAFGLVAVLESGMMHYYFLRTLEPPQPTTSSELRRGRRLVGEVYTRG